MIVAEAGDFEITWEAGTISVLPGLNLQLDALIGSPVARAGIEARRLKFLAEVDRRFGLPAYDPDAFEDHDRSFRLSPGSAEHTRAAIRSLGAQIVEDTEEIERELAAFEAEIRAELGER